MGRGAGITKGLSIYDELFNQIERDKEIKEKEEEKTLMMKEVKINTLEDLYKRLDGMFYDTNAMHYGTRTNSISFAKRVKQLYSYRDAHYATNFSHGKPDRFLFVLDMKNPAIKNTLIRLKKLTDVYSQNDIVISKQVAIDSFAEAIYGVNENWSPRIAPLPDKAGWYSGKFHNMLKPKNNNDNTNDSYEVRKEINLLANKLAAKSKPIKGDNIAKELYNIFKDINTSHRIKENKEEIDGYADSAENLLYQMDAIQGFETLPEDAANSVRNIIRVHHGSEYHLKDTDMYVVPYIE